MSIRTTLLPFRMKIEWAILESNSKWVEFMRCRHPRNQYPSNSKLPNSTTKVWRSIWKCLANLADLSNWEVGQGNITFFYENWTGEGCILWKLGIELNYITLKEVKEQDFKIQGINQDHRESLKAKCTLVSIGGVEDVRIWPFDNSGIFTAKSYYEMIGRKSRKLFLLKSIWSPHIPSKVSFFI